MDSTTADRDRHGNSVAVHSDLGEPPSWTETLARYVLLALSTLGVRDGEIAIRLMGDERMRDLNRRFRSRDEVTDVLSFPGADAAYLGDIAVNLKQVQRQAVDFAVPFEQELRRMVVHGVLHLCGYAHQTNDATIEPMLLVQEELLTQHEEPLF